ncbi:MAG: CopG family transcriptional regulator [Desulfobacteraceae bacterium]|jgi:hypothetical protein|nr:MAG: CopG family transcriptional regulator [Desulfobacteraceae bacterium]
MLTVRISKKMERELDILSQQLHVTKSEIVKKAISEYIKNVSNSPYETGKDLFGCDDSNIVDGSTSYKQNVRRRVHEKHSH